MRERREGETQMHSFKTGMIETGVLKGDKERKKNFFKVAIVDEARESKGRELLVWALKKTDMRRRTRAQWRTRHNTEIG